MSDLWQRCLARLEGEIEPGVLHTWLQPLQARDDDGTLRLFAPNTYTLEFVRNGYLARIEGTLSALAGRPVPLRLEVGSISPVPKPLATSPGVPPPVAQQHNLDPHYTFDNFVEGKSNQLGKAAAMQVAHNPGRAYNPLLLYGGTGLGKTHLMQAAGNLMLKHNPSMKLLYVHSERFTEMMIAALRNKNMDDFKHRFRSVDALLIDDIQFFAGKDATQEEFFHTFNTLYESRQQIILTCDRYPKEVDNLELRLKSRLGWGLSVAIEPPDFETRAAILLEKAQTRGIPLPSDVALLLARRIRSNVRELEGALNTVAAQANLSGRGITVELAQETLRDLFNVHARAITVQNIQKTVADYYQLRLSDLLSQRRLRSLARPRQIAMALAKELTEHSLPEIGEAFGGKDHTTVMHACKKIRSLCDTDMRLRQDWDKLIRILTG
ncbi:MAG: chromosomal replication initiator protein DnaA [Xanthomonadales bacterium]|nr:chromosomal replication initiator protein DnaA [Xanthomonadales bacterium]ODU95028.1 MAG: chromosomal replication initiation protein DnaA [Rhodanobacter sp. SCN 66-43]OJY82229.1 MAG: chromosomal replication initiation protein DnaA [Xanthomonadales bacterium 66-474]